MNLQQTEALKQLGDAIRRDGAAAAAVRDILATIRALSPELVPGRRADDRTRRTGPRCAEL